VKPLHVLSIGLGLLLMSCSLASLPGVSQSSSPTSSPYLLADPTAGLSQLEHYRNTLTTTFQGQQDGQPTEAEVHIDNVVWRQQAAAFSIIDDTDESGQPRQELAGYVGQAAYAQWPDSEGCQVTWGAVSPGAGSLDPADLLPALLSGDDQGEDSQDGIPARHYRLDSDSLGLGEEGQATGDVWIATQGGFVVKYHVEIHGGPTVLGQALDGTRTYDYAISEVNSGAPLSYPNGCEPVLTDVPVPPGASNEERMPGVLSFTTLATQEEVGDFYNQLFAENGWTVTSQPSEDDGYAVWIYERADSDVTATVARDEDEELGFAWVTVNLEGSLNPNVAAAGAVATGVPTAAPGSEAEATPTQDPQAVVQDSLTLLVGSQDSPSVLPSFSYVIDLVLPEGLPQQSESLTGEAEAGAFHLAGSYFGMQVESWRTPEGQFLDASGNPDSGVGLTAWMNWQTVATSAVQTAASAATDTGSETVGGRQAEAFAVSGAASAGNVSGLSGGMGITFSDMQGTIWVDQATGALLKADLTFQAASTLPGMSTESGAGSLTIQVDKVGQAKVELPK
jgi:hypothetical protein